MTAVNWRKNRGMGKEIRDTTLPYRCLRTGMAAAALLCAAVAAAETIIVQPTGPTLREAVARAASGDIVALMPGEYRGQTAVIEGKSLTLRGVGQRPVLIAEGKVAEGKAMIVVRGGEVVIDNLEFRGARAPDANGAGIRFETGKLTVRNSGFFDNECGILAGNVPDAELVVEDSEFGQAPRVEGGLHHLLYVGRIGKFTLRGSRFHSGFEGHLIKSRARENRIFYNLIHDGQEGQASYEIDLPNGGMAWIVGNVIGQSTEGRNPVHVAYGSEGSAWPRNGLYVAHNTFVGNPWPPSWFLRVFHDRLPASLEVRVVNNLTAGLGMLSPGTKGDFAGNHWVLRRRNLISVWSLEFGLPHDSPLRGQGVDPGLGGGEPLAPTAEFKLPVGTKPITRPPSWSPGAYQN